MSGLVGYGSSDEEDIVGDARQTISETSQQAEISSTASHKPRGEPVPAKIDTCPTLTNLEHPTNGLPPANAPEPTQLPTNDPPIGPHRTKTPSPPATTTPTPASSPYTQTRTTLRTLTLPPLPNLTIPPSPPGSPPPGSTSKMTRFLALKHQGVHFNGKLASSAALKNPSLLPKLMRSAGLATGEGEDEGAQYATTLPAGVWDPRGLAGGVDGEGLGRRQREVGRGRRRRRGEEGGGREGVDFVAAVGAAAGAEGSGGPRVGTPGLVERGRRSAAERVMAGLERGGVKGCGVEMMADEGGKRSRSR